MNDDLNITGDEPATPGDPSSEAPAAVAAPATPASSAPAGPDPRPIGGEGGVKPGAGASGADDAPAAAVKDWYILKVQSNREESIREGLQRRVAIEGLQEYFGDVLVPTELVSEFKNGKKRVFKRKLWPGYIVVHMEINDATWHLVRGTPGIGDFVGAAGKPVPLQPQDVAKIVAKKEEKADEVAVPKIAFNPGDRVKIKEGTFENFEGNVENVDAPNGRVTVMINIFGRSTPVELEYWQIESV